MKTSFEGAFGALSGKLAVGEGALASSCACSFSDLIARSSSALELAFDRASDCWTA
jgi:hypothetical protein